jgi:hypothetical protein
MSQSIEELKARLTPQQVAIAYRLVANEFAGKDKKTQDEIAAEFGMSRQALWRLRTQNPDFIKLQALISDMTLESQMAFAQAMLMKAISNGSIKALDLYFRMTGRLINRSEVVRRNESERQPLTEEEIREKLQELNDMLH